MTSILALLESPGTRMVTMSGPGGAGKTRLALQVAAEALDDFADGVFFVDLSAETDPTSAFESVIRSLALPGASGDPLELLQARLRDRKMLLVLDNFEQVVDAAPGVVSLLNRCPGLTVLVTSRETLRVRPEHVFSVPPMQLPDPRTPYADIADAESVQLFVDRARAVSPDFALDEANAAVVAQICLRLDGLPLAIELAAARPNLFTATDLLDRIRGRLDVLGAGGRDLPERQRTLWGAVAWSYELLDGDERRVFELMSVFSPARLDAIEEVCREVLGDVDALEALASLVDKSLVRSDAESGSRRFSMLLMIREFAAERLAETPDFEHAVGLAHANYFCEYTRGLQTSLRGPERQSALDDLEADIGNLRSAWRFWVRRDDLEKLFSLLDGLWTLHDAKGWYHAALELAVDTLEVLSRAESSPERAAEELTIRTSLARALLAIQGYTPEVEQAYRRVLELAEANGGIAQQFPVLKALGTYYTSIAEWERVGEMGARLLELADREGDNSIRVDGHFLVGVGSAFTGRLEEGLEHLETSIATFDPAHHGASRFRLGPLSAVSARATLGMVNWQRGHLDRGVAYMEESVKVAIELGHPYSVAYAHYHHGFLAWMRGHYEEAASDARDLGRVAADNDYPIWATLSTFLEGISLTFLGEVERGLTMTESGVALYQGLTAPPVFWPYIQVVRGLAHSRAGRHEEGLALIQDAIDLIGAPEATPPDFGIAWADVVQRTEAPDLDDAEAAYLSALRGAEAGGMGLFELEAATRLVALRRSRGIEPDMTEELREIYARFDQGHDERALVEARAMLDMDTETAGV